MMTSWAPDVRTNYWTKKYICGDEQFYRIVNVTKRGGEKDRNERERESNIR